MDSTGVEKTNAVVSVREKETNNEARFFLGEENLYDGQV